MEDTQRLKFIQNGLEGIMDLVESRLMSGKSFVNIITELGIHGSNALIPMLWIFPIKENT